MTVIDIHLRILGECVIQVGNRCINPHSTRLFALLLYLCHSGDRAVHRKQLIELLFPNIGKNCRTAQSLRQLVYLVRTLGAQVITEGDRIRLAPETVTSAVDEFIAMSREERAPLLTSTLAVLPAYEPVISSQWTDWVETLRSEATGKVVFAVRDDFRRAQNKCVWPAVVQAGRTLRRLNAYSEEVASGIAQAMLMQGQKPGALDVLDEYLAECGSSSMPTIRRLRARIARSEQSARALESTFRGRSGAMQALARQWHFATTSGPQLAVVTGPAGIGKTRLAHEFGLFAQLDGGRYLTYRCDRSDAATPYALFRSLLPQLRQMRGSLGASPELQPYLDRVTSDATLEGALEPAASEGMKANIQLALTDLLEAVSTEQGLLIVIDDASQLDSASRHVIQGIINSPGRMPVMILCCERNFDGVAVRANDALRAQVHTLAPLSADDSLAILRELVPAQRADSQVLCSCVTRTGGNPYYLHALAYDGLASDDASPGAFDIGHFAASAYHGLAPDARTLFEACLLLGPFASLQRVQAVAAVDPAHVASALRCLENSGMVHFADGELRCTHALLEEAALRLIPSSVAALLHARVAKELEGECGAASDPAALSWAAAEHWLAVDDVAAAGRLLRHCATQAAAFGESQTAAETLHHIPLERLEPAERIPILNQLVEYSEAASDYARASKALRSLLQLKRDAGSSPGALREIEFHIIEADLRHGAKPADAVASLREFVTATDVPSPVRVRASVSLLVAADLALDARLANLTYALIKPELDRRAPENEAWQRAELIFHTVFGDRSEALAIARLLLKRHPTPSILQSTVRHRRFVAFAAIRLGRLDIAKPVLLADYDFMMSRHVATEALYRAVLLSEAFFHEGNLTEARRWLDDAGRLLTSDGYFTTTNEAGYYSASAELALAEGRLDEAEAFVDRAQRTCPAIDSPRFAAIMISLRLRIQHARDRSPGDERSVDRLRAYYKRGRALGAQDCVVEALWLAEHSAGRPKAARRLLRDYLTVYRREANQTAWMLRAATATDPFWSTVAGTVTHK